MTKTKDQKLIGVALDRAAEVGLDRQEFAELLMVRDDRTISRWLYGEVKIPAVARRRLEAFLADPAPTRDGQGRLVLRVSTD